MGCQTTCECTYLACISSCRGSPKIALQQIASTQMHASRSKNGALGIGINASIAGCKFRLKECNLLQPWRLELKPRLVAVKNGKPVELVHTHFFSLIARYLPKAFQKGNYCSNRDTGQLGHSWFRSGGCVDPCKCSLSTSAG